MFFISTFSFIQFNNIFVFNRKEHFENYGKVERVKKIKDYAFVHFEDRDNAVLAMRDLDGKDVGGSHIEVIFHQN